MKKIYYVLALAAVVATAACNKDEDSNPGKDELVGGNINGWLSDRLYGNPKKVVETDYRNVKFDTLTMKAIAPTAADIDEVYTVEYNGAGYRTAREYTSKVITGVKSYNANSGYVKVTTEMRTSSKNRYDYDGSNRETFDEYMSYSHSARYGYDYLYSSNIQGDSLYIGYGYEGSQFELRVDTNYSEKYTTTYDDGAKTATQTYYRYTGGAWEESSKTVYKLNAYGYIDDNATSETYYAKPKAAEYDAKPSYVNYCEADGRGNWTLSYSYSPGSTYISNYSTRDITYY